MRAPSHDDRDDGSNRSRGLLTAALFVVAYFATARAGLRLAYYQQNATLIWAPSGLAVALLWLRGVRFAPAVYLAALVANLSIGTAPLAAAFIAAGNTAEALVAFHLGRRAGLRRGIWRMRDVPAFLALIVAAAPLVAASVGTIGLHLFGGLGTARMLPTALTWWLGDAGGVLVATPLVMAFTRPATRMGRHHVGEVVLLCALALVTTLVAFGGLLPVSLAKLPLALLPYPARVWASVRFGMRGSAVSVAGVSAAAVLGTSLGTGPLHYGNVHVDVAMLWIFMSTMAASAMLLATSIEERTREVLARREGDQWLALALDAGVAHTFERNLVAGTERRHDPAAHTETPAAWSPIATWTDRIDTGDRAAVTSAIEACSARGVDAWECEYRVGERWMLERARVIERDAAGAPKRAVGLRRDVTARHETETQQRALERDLERSQRLSELGVLAGGIAHDFNNLLTIIRANIDHARDTSSANSRREAMDAVETAAMRASDLTEQLLAYAGRKPLRRRDVNIAALAAETVRMLSSGAPSNVTLVADTNAAVPFVESDPAQIRQVHMNLLWNAIEAMEGRTGTVTTRVTSGDDSTAILEVIDKGAGMDEATRARVFEPFFSTKPRGRGLGMAAVLGIVRAHGGRIEVASEIGRGTTFRVHLPATDRFPRASQTSLAAVPPLVAAAASEPADVRDRKARVLVVDDESAIRSIARLLLEDADYVAFEAGNAEEAERCLDESGPIDAVLLDMTMPGTSGLALMKRLREKCPTLRVLLMSGYSEDLVAGRAPADVPFLAKPFRGAGLVERVRATLEGTTEVRGRTS